MRGTSCISGLTFRTALEGETCSAGEGSGGAFAAAGGTFAGRWPRGLEFARSRGARRQERPCLAGGAEALTARKAVG